MKSFEEFLLSITLGIVIAIVIGLTVVRREPPIHCRYMVPVKNVPGSYSCSQYPRPVTYKK